MYSDSFTSSCGLRPTTYHENGSGVGSFGLMDQQGNTTSTSHSFGSLPTQSFSNSVGGGGFYESSTMAGIPNISQLFATVRELQGQLQTTQAQLQAANTQLLELTRINGNLTKENSQLAAAVLQSQTQAGDLEQRFPGRYVTINHYLYW